MPLIIGLFSGVVFCVSAFIMLKHFFSSRSAVMGMIEGFGGHITWFNNGVMDIDGQQVTCEHRPSTKHGRSRFHIIFKGSFFAHAVFRKETQVDRLAKDVGLNREIQLCDPLFDNAVYVECEDQAFVRELLNSSAAKEQLKSILKVFDAFEIDGGRCLLVKTPCKDLPSMDPAVVKDAVRSMVALALRIPVVAPARVSLTPLTDERRSWVSFLGRTSALLLIVAIGCVVWGVSCFEPLFPGRFFRASLFVSIPLTAVFCYYVFTQLKGLSTGLSCFSFTAAVGGAGIILLVWGGGLVVNGSQDVSVRVVHEVPVISKWVTRSKNSRTYHIQVPSWSKGLLTYKFSVPYVDYGRIHVGDRCAITTAGGLLGFEWIVSHQCR